MAGRAGLREASLVRVLVAIRAQTERDSGVTQLAVGAGNVAFGAGDGPVQARQGEACFRVIELAWAGTNIYALPVLIGVALQTVLTQASVVLVLVAAGAGLREAQVSASEIQFDGRPLRSDDVGWRVTLVAGQAGVFAFQEVPGLTMIKYFQVPLDQRKIFAVVFGVAARAFLARSGGELVRAMQSFARCDSAGYVGMAILALQGCHAAQFVAGRTVGDSAKGLMRTGQRAGRNLRGGSGLET